MIGMKLLYIILFVWINRKAKKKKELIWNENKNSWNVNVKDWNQLA